MSAEPTSIADLKVRLTAASATQLLVNVDARLGRAF